MRKKDYQKYYDKYKTVVNAIARKLGGSDDDLVEDLKQEGFIALWSLDPDKSLSNKDAWIRMAIRNRMIDELRRQNPQQYESLDKRIEAGDQIQHDPVTGEVRIVSAHSDNFRRAAAQEEEED